MNRTETDQLRKLAAKWHSQANHPMRQGQNRAEEREALHRCADQLLALLRGRTDTYDPVDPPRSAAMALMRKTRPELVNMYATASPDMALAGIAQMTNEQIVAALLDRAIG